MRELSFLSEDRTAAKRTISRVCGNRFVQKTGALVAPYPPQNLEFVEKALEFLLKGEFAPRSNRDVAESTHSFEVSVRKASNPNGPLSDIVVPDVTGELWKKTLETYEIPKDWMLSLERASGALLFVREGSEENEVALDWITCGKFLTQRAKARAARNAKNDATDSPADVSGESHTLPGALGNDREQGSELDDDKSKPTRIPTQIALCELLRFLEFGMKRTQGQTRPRVAVLVTAWDRLDKEKRIQGPIAYLRSQYPMFAGRLRDIETLEVKAFGVSVVSGDFADPVFKAEFYEKGMRNVGYVVTDDKPDEFLPDLTLPVSWVMSS